MAETIPESEWQALALRDLAVTLARAGQTEETLAVVRLEPSANRQAAVLKDLARALTLTEPPSTCLLVAEAILANRERHLPAIAEAFARQRNRAGVKAMLPLCAEHPLSACWVLASLLRVYPEHARAILAVAWPYLSGRKAKGIEEEGHSG